jgi:type II secretory pathway predicted ATPase ExeA/HAMP domain-containing protein
MIQLSGRKISVESHFGFQEPPFGVTPNPRFYYTNTAYRDALAEVAHGILAKKGLMLVTGEVGTGKTILLRKLMHDLGATVKFIFISSSQLSSNGIVDVVSTDLGLANKKTKVEMGRDLTKYLLQRATTGQVVALLVDEAQNTSDRGFEGLCGLSNLETDDEKLLQIVLVGQPELLNVLEKPSFRQIKQRVAIQHTVTGLQTKSELEHYIYHRLHVAGYNGPEIFTQEALEAIWEYSAGTPRLVNILCDNSLTLACEAGTKSVSGEVAIKAAEKFRLKRVAQLPTFVDSEIASGAVTHLAPAVEANGTDIRMEDWVHRPAISPISSDTASVRQSHSFVSEGLSLDTTEQPAQLPTSSEEADSVRSEAQSKPNAQLTGAIESPRAVTQTRSRNSFGLRWKIAGVFSALTLILSAVLIGTVYRLTEGTLREQVDKRALAIARNLSDASAGHMLSNDLLALNTLLRKYTFDDGLAYAFIRDSRGAITAHSFETFPPELHEGLSAARERVPWRRELSLQGRRVYETNVPVLDGQLGVVHVGFWGDAIEKEIRRAIRPLIAAMGIIPLVGVVLSFFLAHWIAAPIIRLTKVTERIIEGDLDASGEYPKSRDEIGDLARSLERMRASLRAAMSRLQRELG